MDNCWISCQVMANMKFSYDDLIIINLYVIDSSYEEIIVTVFFFLSCIFLNVRVRVQIMLFFTYRIHMLHFSSCPSLRKREIPFFPTILCLFRRHLYSTNEIKHSGRRRWLFEIVVVQARWNILGRLGCVPNQHLQKTSFSKYWFFGKHSKDLFPKNCGLQ